MYAWKVDEAQEMVKAVETLLTERVGVYVRVCVCMCVYVCVRSVCMCEQVCVYL